MTKSKNKPKKPKAKKQAKQLEAKTTQIVFDPDVFDLELIESLKKKIGRTTNDILKLALMQLYTDMCIVKERHSFEYPFWQIPNQPPYFQQDESIGIKITCNNDNKINLDPAVPQAMIDTLKYKYGDWI